MGAGGGGSTGQVSYPVYVEAIHADWLANCGVLAEGSGRDFMNNSVTDRLAAAIGNSPFSGETAYDGATRIATMETEINAFETIVDALSETTDWAAILAQAVTTIDANWTAPTPAASGEIAAAVTAFEAIQDDRVEETVLPRFQRGMQDIGGVLTSAFVIGQAIIEGMVDRDVAQYQGELRTKAYLLKDQLVADSLLKKNIAYTLSAEHMIKYVEMMLSANQALAGITVQTQQFALEAERSEAETQLEIDEADVTWDLSVFQYGANVMAAPGGGTAVSTKRGPTRTQAMIGGAAAGAAMGTAISPGYGTAIGAVVGAAAGYASTT